MQLVGVDGNFLSFTFGCAAIMNTDSDTFLWVMEQCVAAYGADACAAVHWVLGDEDPGQNAAFEEAKNKVCILTVHPNTCAVVVRAGYVAFSAFQAFLIVTISYWPSF